MDGISHRINNVLIERLWRSVKYEKLRVWSYPRVQEASQLVSDLMEFYNNRQNHSALGGQSLWTVNELEITGKTAT
ncbi:integrase core domain-containing protein [Akkermansiaceae bacterium]|nr:integrase core domain-containing protein [Akkermansiaceae bacterium]